jgi:hypothetical protein
MKGDHDYYERRGYRNPDAGWVHEGREFIPLTIRTQSRLACWIWRKTHISYETGRRLARWLP